jgi:hypothetical protein
MVREVDGEVVVLDVETDKVHQLNATASFIWRLCEEGQAPEVMARRLAERFDVAESVAFQDASVIIEQLRALGLVVEG